MSRNKVFDALDKTFKTMPTESNPVKPLSDKNDVNTDFKKRDPRKAMSYSEQPRGYFECCYE